MFVWDNRTKEYRRQIGWLLVYHTLPVWEYYEITAWQSKCFWPECFVTEHIWGIYNITGNTLGLNKTVAKREKNLFYYITIHTCLS